MAEQTPNPAPVTERDHPDEASTIPYMADSVQQQTVETQPRPREMPESDSEPREAEATPSTRSGPKASHRCRNVRGQALVNSLVERLRIETGRATEKETARAAPVGARADYLKALPRHKLDGLRAGRQGRAGRAGQGRDLGRPHVGGPRPEQRKHRRQQEVDRRQAEEDARQGGPRRRRGDSTD